MVDLRLNCRQGHYCNGLVQAIVSSCCISVTRGNINVDAISKSKGMLQI